MVAAFGHHLKISVQLQNSFYIIAYEDQERSTTRTFEQKSKPGVRPSLYILCPKFRHKVQILNKMLFSCSKPYILNVIMPWYRTKTLNT